MANEALGNVMSRLSGIKSVSGRRVRNQPEFLQNLAQGDTDVSGTASPEPPYMGNAPEPDLGGELTSQSYDVRANTAANPADEEGMGASFRKLGANLWNSFKEGWTPNVSDETRQQFGIKPMAQAPPIATAQVDAQEGLPPVTASEEESPGFFGTVGKALKDYVQPFKSEGIWQGEPTPENALLSENAQLRSQGHVPDEYRAEQKQIHTNTQNSIHDRTDKALENPLSTVVYGATDMVANQPDLNAAFKEISGINIDDEVANQTEKYEKVLENIDNINDQDLQKFSEQEQRILQRIQDNETTDADKFYIGLAVMMPLIVGAFFGKEAAIGALGGGAQGFANILGQRKKENMENEKLLTDINQNKSNIGLKKAEIDLKRVGLPSEIRKNLPKDENEHLIGKKEVTWTDPNTGQQMKGVGIKPGLVALPEYVKDKDELKEMRKQAVDISAAINPVQEINKLTGDIISVSSKMSTEDKGILGTALINIVSGKSPGIATKLGKPVEYEGRTINSYVFLEHKLKLLVDAYRRAKGMRALTETVQTHLDGLFRNPAATFQSFEDTIDQMMYTREVIQDGLINNVQSSGFVPEFVIERLQPNSKKIYGMLNEKAGEKEASELLRG